MPGNAFGPFGGRFSSLPQFPGKYRLVDAAASVVRRFGSNEQVVRLWPETNFHVDLRDRIQRQMWCGSYEPHVTRCLNAILRPGDVFVDVGANIGYHSFFAAGVVGEKGKVFSFEPDPGVHMRLENNLRPFPWAHALNYAIWDREDEVRFKRSSVAHESGWGRLTAVRSLGTGEEISVHAISLDGWKRKAHETVIRAIKLDAEGSELGVLRGASNMLSDCRPYLLLEINDVVLRQAGASATHVLNELDKHAYRVYEVAGDVLQQSRISISTPFADCLCLPEECAETCLEFMGKNGFQVGLFLATKR